MENSPLRQMVKLREEGLNQEFIKGLSDGFKPINKAEFHRIANQLTLWNVSNSGAVIKREGPSFVRMAVNITLQNLVKAKSPKAYFRGVLKKLQNMSL